MKQYVIQHITARPGRVNGNLEIFLDLLLADIFPETARPQANLKT
jgi:hypothetical protein